MTKNLLIVDDESELISVLRFMLKNLANEIHTAAAGPEAISVLEREDIHCVLCDVNLPRMNGLEIFRTIRGKGLSTPFIFFTADEDPAMLAEAARLGAIDFLFKPHFYGIEQAIAAVFEGRTHTPTPDSRYGRILAR